MNRQIRMDELVRRIRPAVRDRRPYLVGFPEATTVKLNQNESPYDLPPEVKEEVLREFARIPFNRYPDEFSERLAHTFAAYAGCDPDGVIVGNGSNDLAGLLVLALIERGTPVVLPRPMFSLYAKLVLLHDGDLLEVPCREDFRFDTDALVEAAKERRPSLIMLATPNNPTGLAMKLDEIAAVADASEGFVVVDEAYLEFSEEGSALRLTDEHPNLILLRTFSKACGLAGLRLGFLIAHPDVLRELRKARMPFMIDPLASAAAHILLTAYPDVIEERARRIRQDCIAITAALAAMEGVEAVPSQTNFVLFRTTQDAADLKGRFLREGVLVRSMSGYPELQDFLRVNAGTEVENKAFMTALKRALSV